MTKGLNEEVFIAGWRSSPAARNSFIAEVVRELSKSGSLENYEEVLGCLSRHLPKDEVLFLFRSLQKSRRPESEWRMQFLVLFPTVDISDLPKPIVDEEVADRLARDARANQAFGQVQAGSPEIPF